MSSRRSPAICALSPLSPDFELKTELARSVLPGEIPRQDGVFNLSRAALMSVSLYSGNYQNLRVAAQDRLHQPYRLELIPHAREVFDLCYSLGAYGVYISGAGSTIMAIVDEKDHSFFDRAEQGVEQLGLTGWQLKQLAIDNQGTHAALDCSLSRGYGGILHPLPGVFCPAALLFTLTTQRSTVQSQEKPLKR